MGREGNVDYVNFYSPVRDAVESVGSPGQVLRSQGPNAAPVWAGEGGSSSVPGPGSGSDHGITGGPVFVYADDAASDGPLVFLPPTTPQQIGSFLLQIQGLSETRGDGEWVTPATGQNRGAFDLLLQVDLVRGQPVSVTVQGISADIDCYVATRPDGSLAVVLGNARTHWDRPFLSITRLWASGPDAATWASGWVAVPAVGIESWTLFGAQPIGYQQGLGPPNAVDGGGGRFSSCIGGFSAGGVVVGALVWELTEESPVQMIVQMVGVGKDGPVPTVNCWIRLGRGVSRGEPLTQVEVVNHAPSASPQIRTAQDGAGRNYLIAGDVGTVWRRPAVALTAAVTGRSLGDLYRPVWPCSLRLDLSDLTITGESIEEPPSAEGQALTPGLGLSGEPFDGTRALTWNVDQATLPVPNLGVLTPGAGLSGTPYNGKGSVTWTVTGGGGPGALSPLTPAGFITGGAFDGTTPQTWTVNATSAANANALMARDGNADVWARQFHGELSGNAASASRLAPGARINGILFDGTADIQVGDQGGGSAIAVLTPGAGIAGQPFDGSTAQTWTVDAAALPAPDLSDLVPGAHIVGERFDGRVERTWSVNAVAAPTGSTIPLRDAGGALEATVFRGSLSGNADSASRLATPRLIGGAPFDGTADITLPPQAVALLSPGNGLNGTAFNGLTPQTWAVNASSANEASRIVQRDANGDFWARRIGAATFEGSLAGLATAASALAPGARINGILFNGTQDITIPSGMNLFAACTYSWNSSGNTTTATVVVAGKSSNIASIVVRRPSPGGVITGEITFSTPVPAEYVPVLTQGAYMPTFNAGRTVLSFSLNVAASSGAGDTVSLMIVAP